MRRGKIFQLLFLLFAIAWFAFSLYRLGEVSREELRPSKLLPDNGEKFQERYFSVADDQGVFGKISISFSSGLKSSCLVNASANLNCENVLQSYKASLSVTSDYKGFIERFSFSLANRDKDKILTCHGLLSEKTITLSVNYDKSKKKYTFPLKQPVKLINPFFPQLVPADQGKFSLAFLKSAVFRETGYKKIDDFMLKELTLEYEGYKIIFYLLKTELYGMNIMNKIKIFQIENEDIKMPRHVEVPGFIFSLLKDYLKKGIP